MNIRIDRKNYGCNIVVEADNVKIEEDIEERQYPLNAEGNMDFSVKPTRDINTEAIDQFITVLEDLIYYREKEYDSSDLILLLFDKLPQETVQEVLKTLNDEYGD